MSWCVRMGMGAWVWLGVASVWAQQAPPTLGAVTMGMHAAAEPVSASEPGLRRALQTALQRHPSLMSKQAQVQAKQAAADGARAMRYPTLSASTGAGQTEGYSGTRTTSVRAQQPLWAFGRIDRTIAYADADVRAQSADLWQTGRQLLEETAVAYATVQGTRERLLVATQNVQRHQELQQQIQRRAQGGLASPVDVSMAQTRLLQARAQRESAASDLLSALANLLAYTQDRVDSELPVPRDVTLLPDGEQVSEEVLSQSAALRTKQSQWELAQADAERERTASLPTVVLEASRNHVSGLPNTRNSTSMNVVLQGALEGMGFVARGREAAALARAEAVRQELNLARHDLTVRVQQLLDKRASDQALLAGYAESVATLDGTLASFRRQYESGYKSWLDVLNAVRELSEQQLQQAQVQSSWRVNTLRLAAMMGRLDEPAGLAMAPESTP